MLGLHFLDELCAGIVLAVVMVVPGSEDEAVLLEALVTGLTAELLVFGAEFVHVRGVTVDVVPKEDEQVGVQLDDRVPDWLGVVLLGAGTEGDCLNRC